MEITGIGQILLRMVAIFFVALVVVRLMGNRTVGQFSPFDFVLMVGIGDIVGNVALTRNDSLLTGIEALAGLFLLQQLLAWSSLKSKVLRKWFEGQPVVLIDNGRIIPESLVKTQFNLDDLRQELHKHGLDFTNLKDIKLARLESCGEFSVIKARDTEPLTRRDLEEFFCRLSENPLSPQGSVAVRLERLSADVAQLAKYAKQQVAVEADIKKRTGSSEKC